MCRARAARSGERGSCQRERKHRREQQLQEQQQIATEFLPRAVRFHLAEQFLPEQDAGDGLVDVRSLQQIQSEDRRERQQPEQHVRREQFHPDTTPVGNNRRNTASSTLSFAESKT
ncbi:hypothetical protein EL26_17590 [Tumebacillus flagellatus]|uniref:Uncharacterized protein n=1 Tax=Tumebacillus flagellatus TaxID=1157490 RepID=A0A074LN95_9BACL|nr:hypothetical protein EL26_17590 [Tumebacillus flagellatus]